MLIGRCGIFLKWPVSTTEDAYWFISAVKKKEGFNSQVNLLPDNIHKPDVNYPG